MMSSQVSTEDQIIEIRSESNNGRQFVVESGDVLLITAFGVTEAKGDCFTGFAMKYIPHHCRLYSLRLFNI